MALGKWDKQFIDGDQWVDDQPLFNRVTERDQQVKAYFEEQERIKKLKEIELAQKLKERGNRPFIPGGATHVIDGSGFRELTPEEKATGLSRDQLSERWFRDKPQDRKMEL